MVPYLLEKLQAVNEGGASLLDKTLLCGDTSVATSSLEINDVPNLVAGSLEVVVPLDLEYEFTWRKTWPTSTG